MHPILRLGFLLQKLETVDTRIKMQKLVHILQVTGAPFPEEFRFHLYGPYSSDLRAELDAFASEKLIKESKSGNSYSVSPTAKLLKLVALAELEPPAWTVLAAELNKKEPKDLEAISTILYFHQWGFYEQDWKGKFEELKSHLAKNYDTYLVEAKKLLEHNFAA